LKLVLWLEKVLWLLDDISRKEGEVFSMAEEEDIV
jgi:hypothetical protein